MFLISGSIFIAIQWSDIHFWALCEFRLTFPYKIWYDRFIFLNSFVEEHWKIAQICERWQRMQISYNVRLTDYFINDRQNCIMTLKSCIYYSYLFMFHMAPVISFHEPNLLCLRGSCLQKVTHSASLAVSVKDDSAVLFCDLTVLTTMLPTLLLPQHLVYPEYYEGVCGLDWMYQL